MNRRSPFQSDFRSLSPYDALCDSAHTFVFSLAQELGTSNQLVACMLLSIFAAAQVGVGCQVWEKFIVHLSFYIACGAPPSTGKSPIIKRLLQHLHALISKYILFSKDEVEKRKALMRGLERKIVGLEKMISKSDDYEQQIEYAERISILRKQIEDLAITITPMMGKITIQSFVKELALRGGFGFQIDPEGGILAALNTVSTTDLTPILQAWSNEPISDVSKKVQSYADFSSFVMSLFWQTEPLCGIMRDIKYRDIGFPARFLIHIERDLQPRVGSGNVSAESEAWYLRQLEMVFCKAWLPKCSKDAKIVYRLSDDAQIVYKNFKQYVISLLNHDTYLSKCPDIIGKIDIHAIRLAMVLQSIEYGGSSCCEISAALMHKSCCLSLYFADNQSSIFISSNYEDMLQFSTETIEEIARWQKNNSYGLYISYDELRRILGYSKLKLDKILFWFEKNKWVNKKIRPTTRSINGVNFIEEWELLIDFKSLL